MVISKKEWKSALRWTLPVMTGYLFLGVAFGLVLNQAGFSWIWAIFMSAYLYTGALQFLLIPLLGSGITLWETAVLAFMVNIRHLFYGFSFLDEFSAMGAWKPYMIHTLTDETYSLLTGLETDPETDRHGVMLLVSALDQIYWVAGSLAGALLGQAIPWDLAGIEFSMTALFTVVFVEQWIKAKNHLPALMGIGAATLLLVVLGPEQFLPPALVATVGLLLIGRKRGWINE